MRLHILTSVSLSAFGLLANAAAVHIDVSHGGDISVDYDLNVKARDSPRRAITRADRPLKSPAKNTRVLDEYQVDLGYEIHQGFLSDDSKYVKFGNIPYGEMPENGDGRWLPPVLPYPPDGEPKVNKGLVSKICPQMQVGWVPKAFEFLADFADTDNELPPEWEERDYAEDYGTMPEQAENASEDCLTLDVVVPKSVWENRKNRRRGYAVVVWIFGGGYIFGWKGQAGDPVGLLETAAKEQGDEVIYVAIDYRLGAFGWLGGKKFEDQGGVPNIGLHDQAAALQWVKDYIYQFGGDTSRITVIGQSAGASSIMHQITAYGGNLKRPVFQKAILQSPAFFPKADDDDLDRTYDEFLRRAGAVDFDDLLTKDTNTLMRVNAEMTFESKYGIFKFGPTTDGSFVPDLPGKLLKAGRFHKGISLLLGKTQLEGLLFTPPWVRTNEDLKAHIREMFPNIKEATLNTIVLLYPTVALPRPQILRTSDVLDDVAVDCNLQYLTEATLNSGGSLPHPVYRYVFNAPPALHGSDVNYTFYPQQVPSPLFPPDASLATFMQSSFVDFARYYDPNPEDSEFWTEYKAGNRKVMNFGNKDINSGDYSSSMGDDVQWLKKGICEFWQNAPYYPSKAEDIGLVKQSNRYKEYL